MACPSGRDTPTLGGSMICDRVMVKIAVTPSGCCHFERSEESRFDHPISRSVDRTC
jgi:hypothetical protein